MTWHYAQMHDPLRQLRQAAAERAAATLNRELVPRDRGLVDLASNDYLGLAGDPRLAEAAASAASAYGVGSTGSRLVSGTTELHSRLEAALAAFSGAARALVFSSGYLANLAAVTALSRALGDVLLVSDEKNHASVIDASRMARNRGCRLAVVPHSDVAAVRAALAGRAERHAIVLTESVYSVSGDLAPLSSLYEVTQSHGALLLADEAHAFGVLGKSGLGACGLADIAGQPDVVRTISLAKSLGGQGGAVLGADEVIGTLVDVGRSFIFDAGVAPPSAGAALAAVEVLGDEPWRGEAAHAAASRLARLARSYGLDASSPAACVVCVTLGEPDVALAAKRLCASAGVAVGCFRPPSVPAGQACLRLTGRANMTETDFAAASRALAAVRDHCRVTAKAGRNTP